MFFWGLGCWGVGGGVGYWILGFGGWVLGFGVGGFGVLGVGFWGVGVLGFVYLDEVCICILWIIWFVDPEDGK